jgi:hypothetical protein
VDVYLGYNKARCDWFKISEAASHVVVCGEWEFCHFIDNTGKTIGKYDFESWNEETDRGGFSWASFHRMEDICTDQLISPIQL